MPPDGFDLLHEGKLGDPFELLLGRRDADGVHPPAHHSPLRPCREHRLDVRLVDGEIRAEIDLTGAPPPLIEALLPLAVDALRCVVAWLLEPVQFLVDVTHACADATLQPGWA